MRQEPNAYYRFKGSRPWEPCWYREIGMGLVELTETDGHSSKPLIYALDEIDIRQIMVNYEDLSGAKESGTV